MKPNLIESFDIQGFLTSLIAERLIEQAFIGIKNAIQRINKQQKQITIKKIDESECINFISSHLSDNVKWASNISFRDAFNAKTINEIFVNLDLYIAPIKIRIETSEKIPTIPISNILSDTEKNIILLGQPGAGKTTSIKKIFLETIFKTIEVYKVFSFPIVLRLKELKTEDKQGELILFKELFNTMGVFYHFEENVNKSAQEKIMVHFFKDFVERMDVLIILDGYDEISSPEIKKEVIRNLNLITNSTTNSKFILTSRSADYNIHIENTKEYELCPLSEKQINEFVKKWLNDPKESSKLINQLRKSPYWDTTMRPLTLAHLCALFERNKSIPEKPKTVYKKIISLLLEDWSTQRSIERKSKYSKFEVDRKMEFLSKFAYKLTTEYHVSSFNDSSLESIYKTICSDFDLPSNESQNVLQEIESHNGLIIQTGSTKYEFAHKSLLEYLVADYLVKLPIIIRETDVLQEIPNELAIMLAISSNPNFAYFQLICNSLKDSLLLEEFMKPFFSRLIIERPDFESNFLFALTNTFIINTLALRIKLLETEGTKLTETTEDEDNEAFRKDIKKAVKYYFECFEIILTMNESDTFKKSCQDLENYYHLSIINLTDRSDYNVLKRYGSVMHLRKKTDTIEIHGLPLNIPDNLYLLNVIK